MSATSAVYQELLEELQTTSLLESCSSLLGWDEQTNLPPRGTEHRANQLALLAGLGHDRNTAPRLGDLISALEQEDLGDPAGPMSVNVREARRKYDRATKLPKTLVQELSRISTLSQHAWVTARQASDFSEFQPWLSQIVDLKQQEAEALGYADGVPYDALLDDYEPGATTTEVTEVFAALRDELVELVRAIADSSHKPNCSLLTRHYPQSAQRAFGLQAASAIGFDFDAGRLDIAAHPFCSGIGPGDCRLTTRYDEAHFPGAFFGTLHEAGHGMYEQGLCVAAYGTAMGESTSLGIHESQSRMWENFVGRSLAFWEHFYPAAQSAFPGALSDVTLADFHSAVNAVEPSLIRVEADEVTYNLHIMLRFELEQQLLTGDLSPSDVPEAWNASMENYLGVKPENDADGCLQDIHWSGGGLGYFPTYALGNMYAAQLFQAAESELGSLDAQFAKGQFQPLREWLNKTVHARGKQYAATDLIQVVTGQPLSHKPLMQHLHHRFDELYSL
ncbi:MAG: carboxypeptidase M32 [Planctomycetaceae bacterium]